MRDAAEWVERYRKFWEDQLDSLSRYLEREAPRKRKADQQEETQS